MHLWNIYRKEGQKLMPTASGISVLGAQRVLGPGGLTIAQVELLTAAVQPNIPKRIGYGFITVRQTNQPTNRRVLQRGPIYAPGIFYTFTNLYGFSNTSYEWWINWNVAGIAWVVTYA